EYRSLFGLASLRFQGDQHLFDIAFWCNVKGVSARQQLLLCQHEEGFSRDVTNIGHWGTGDVELIVRNEHDLDKAKLLIEKAWQE
ncbi:BcsE family c-di-GMP-binding protein, partial [Salmonella enterica subsp. enterica serovar Montevideo]|nr:BcsE family c-di-GMP-binding protein [Salmonella enterica subsp. enterica serovar Montevideo]